MDVVYLRLKQYEKILFNNSINYNIVQDSFNIIEKYIKENKCILYGGMAIDMALKKANYPGIYDDNVLPDFDILTNDYIELSNKIASHLHQFNIYNISVINALHVSTRKVRVNFENVADITHVPDDIFKNIPTEIYNGFTFVHPHYQMIDMHRALCYLFENPPMESINFRITKDMYRYSLLIKAYPIVSEKQDFTNAIMKKSKIPKIKGDIDGVHGGIIAYAHIYDFLHSKLGLADKMEDILPITIDNKNIEYPAVFEKCIDYIFITDEFDKLKAKKINNAVLSLWGPSVEIDNCLYIDNYGDLLSIGYVNTSTKIVNIQWLLMWSLYQYVINKKEDYILMYTSCSKMIDLAVQKFEEMSDEKQTMLLDIPLFINNIVYGSANYSQQYLLIQQSRMKLIDEIEPIMVLPPHYYPNKSDTWEPYNHSNLQVTKRDLINKFVVFKN